MKTVDTLFGRPTRRPRQHYHQQRTRVAGTASCVTCIVVAKGRQEGSGAMSDHIRGFMRTYRIHGRRKDPRLVSRSGFRPFISNCGAALSRRASRASWSGRLLDDASDQYRRPASHWPLLLGAVENRPGDDGQEEARGRWRKRNGWAEGMRYSRADLPSFLPFFLHPSTASGHSLQLLLAFAFSFQLFVPAPSRCLHRLTISLHL